MLWSILLAAALLSTVSSEPISDLSQFARRRNLAQATIAPLRDASPPCFSTEAYCSVGKVKPWQGGHVPRLHGLKDLLSHWPGGSVKCMTRVRPKAHGQRKVREPRILPAPPSQRRTGKGISSKGIMALHPAPHVPSCGFLPSLGQLDPSPLATRHTPWTLGPSFRPRRVHPPPGLGSETAEAEALSP